MRVSRRLSIGIKHHAGKTSRRGCFVVTPNLVLRWLMQLSNPPLFELNIKKIKIMKKKTSNSWSVLQSFDGVAALRGDDKSTGHVPRYGRRHRPIKLEGWLRWAEGKRKYGSVMTLKWTTSIDSVKNGHNHLGR
jgi:hypothetical protein